MRRLFVLLLMVLVTAAACGSPRAQPEPQFVETGGDPILIAAGDIASCSSTGDEATAAILGTVSGAIASLGDNVYDSGTATEFTNCYAATWGQRLADTHPSPGNHDYVTANATGYYGYFGTAAGDPAKGYYSYNLGAWHIIVINSNCVNVGGCGAGSPQETWLRADLAANPTACTLAYWHHPRYSSGATHGSQTFMQPIWQALYDYGADVVLGGHEHNYERFALQGANGGADPFGIRQFVVGTGGRSHYGFGTVLGNSEVRNSNTYGVLALTLHPDGYDWQFLREVGKTFTDSGTTACHGTSQAVMGGADRDGS